MRADDTGSTSSLAAVVMGGVLLVSLFATGAMALKLEEPSGTPAEIGQWLEPFDGEVPAVNLALLNDGRVVYYSGVEADETYTNTDGLMFIHKDYPAHAVTRVMPVSVDDETGVVSYEVQTPDPELGGELDLFCSGTTVRPDGTVFAAGGSEWFTLDMADPEDPENVDAGNTPVKGVKQTVAFDPATNTWTEEDDMAVDRWYPSIITLADGTTLAASGIQNLAYPNTHNTLVELFGENGWEELETKVVLAETEEGDVAVDQGDRFADMGIEGGPEWVGETDTGLINLPLYPRLYQVPAGERAGEVFYETVGTLWGPFGEHPHEALFSVQQSLDLETGEWELIQTSTYGARQHAATVPLLLDPAEDYELSLLTFGGTLQRSTVAIPFAEMTTIRNDGSVDNQAVEDLNHARWHHNGVLLPDGQVLAVGGAFYDNVILHGADNTGGADNAEPYDKTGINVAEVFDPETGEWTELAEAQVARGYHSTAVLLADGRVLVGGHTPLPQFHKAQRDTVMPQIAEQRFEIFEPPYLHLDEDTRPMVTLDDEDDVYANGETVTLAVRGLEDEALHSVVLMRPGATTHAYDADQRGVVLGAEVVETTPAGVTIVKATLPEEATVAAPGHWMVFVNEDVDGQAFPSEAAFLQIE